MQIKIKSITCITNISGSDTLIIQTEDLEPSTFPFKECPTIKMEVAHCDGPRYCETNFPGVLVTIVQCIFLAK